MVTSQVFSALSRVGRPSMKVDAGRAAIKSGAPSPPFTVTRRIAGGPIRSSSRAPERYQFRQIALI